MSSSHQTISISRCHRVLPGWPGRSQGRTVTSVMYGIGIEDVGPICLGTWEKLRLRAVVGAIPLRRRHAGRWVFIPATVPFRSSGPRRGGECRGGEGDVVGEVDGRMKR